MATLKNLLENGLKVGALVKAYNSVFQYKCGEEFYILKTDSQSLELNAGNGIFDVAYLEYLFLSAFDGKLTTAYDCGISTDSLPIAEPVDVTGWVVDSEGYKHQIEHWHQGETNYANDFDEENEMQPDYFEFTNGGHAFVYECRACLPPA